MVRNKDLAIRLREVWLNGKWIANTNFKEQLQDISCEQAIEKIENLNTIAQLIFHVNYYTKGILEVFHGGPLSIKDQFSFDMEPIDSELKWNALVQEFLNNSEQMANEVEALPDAVLDEVFTDENYGTYLRNIEGLIEHSYYHLGQVSLLLKLIRKK